MLLELVLLVASLIGIWACLEKRVKNFPPGPVGFPVVGHLPQLGKNPHRTLAQWKKIYGPIIGVWFGSYRTVAINDSKLIKEALSLNVFSGRSDLSFFNARSEGVTKGILFTEGHRWTEQRSGPVLNALWSIMFGERLPPEDPEVADVLRRLGTAFNDTSFIGSP
ncbi:unnamed protein product, partial [Allacma fusca]